MKHFLLLLSLLSLFACSDSTSPDTNSISGYVTLENSEDYSEVVIKLYKKNNDIDNDLFDHRFTEHIYETVTNNEGHYEISFGGNLDSYFIVFEKDGYGYKYLQGNSENNEVELYQEVIVPEIITGDYVFEANRHYVFNQNTIFLENSIITLYQGAVLKIAENKRVNIYGSINELTTATNLITKFTSIGCGLADGIFISNTNEIQLTNIVINNFVYGVNFEYCENISLYNVKIFNNSNKGLLLSHCTDININGFFSQDVNNVPSSSSVYTSEGVIYILNSENIGISNLEIRMSQVGIKINNSQTGVLNNLNIYDCYYGVELYDSQIDVTNSLFTNNKKMDMRICGEGSQLIKYNIFNSDLGIMVGLDMNFNYYDANPVINYNDFYNQNIALKLYGFNRIDVNAINNYYNTTNIDEINEKVIDGADLVPGDHFYGITKEFIIEPYKNKPNN